METSEILEEIKKMTSNQDRIDRVNRFIDDDPKFKPGHSGELLKIMPKCLLFLLKYKGPIDEVTEARYYSQHEIPIVDEDTFKHYASEIRSIRKRFGE